jgi:hypothetical protein
LNQQLIFFVCIASISLASGPILSITSWYAKVLYGLKLQKLEGSSNLEQELFEISDDCFDKGEDDVVGIEDVNVCSGLAELDTSDGRGLRHGL